MRKRKKRTLEYIIGKLVVLALAAVPPCVAIAEKFPIWKSQTNKGTALGVGAVMMIAVILIVLRNVIVKEIEKVFKLGSLVSMTIGWTAGFLVLLYVAKIITIIMDLQTVCLAGAIGGLAAIVVNIIIETIHKSKNETGVETNGNDGDESAG